MYLKFIKKDVISLKDGKKLYKYEFMNEHEETFDYYSNEDLSYSFGDEIKVNLKVYVKERRLTCRIDFNE